MRIAPGGVVVGTVHIEWIGRAVWSKPVDCPLQEQPQGMATFIHGGRDIIQHQQWRHQCRIGQWRARQRQYAMIIFEGGVNLLNNVGLGLGAVAKARNR